MDGVAASALFLFAATICLAILSPGPAIVSASRMAAAVGAGTAMPYSLGLAFGASLWCLLAVFGLTTIFTAFPGVFTLMEVIGGIYLLYIGAKMIAHAKDPLDITPRVRAARFGLGVRLNLSNPKPALFYGSLLLGFFPHMRGVLSQMAVYATALATETLVYAGVTQLMATQVVRRGYFSAKTAIDRFAGLFIIVIGLSLFISVTKVNL